MRLNKHAIVATGVLLILAVFVLVAVSGTPGVGPALFGIRAEFFLFAITLVGVALLHEHTMYVALTGLASITALKLIFLDGFDLPGHLWHELPILLNLLGLLLGFAILAKHFEQSNVPDILPRFLPDSWLGGFVLLTLVFVISTFLDNIAAAMIGGTVALVVFKSKVHIGFLAAIVAASNAGGAGSVVGDTTTTMMWIAGVPPIEVLHAFVAGVPALLIFGIISARMQQNYQPIQKDEIGHHTVGWAKLGVVALILAGAIVANFAFGYPAAGVWIAIILGASFTSTPWKEIQNSIKGAIFLLALVTCASMMPVEYLPAPSAMTAFSLGVISAVFDNIPLTALAIKQDGYDWGMLAYTVGFGGSMIWFGSSAGVALTNQFPEGKSVVQWLRHGWSVALGYVVGFLVLYFTLGWNPHVVDTSAGAHEAEHPAAHGETPAAEGEAPAAVH